MKVNFYRRKSGQLFATISLNGTRTPVYLDIWVDKLDMWDKKKKQVKLKYPEEAGSINPKLTDWEARAIELEEKYEPKTALLLKRIITGIEESTEPKEVVNDFFQFFEAYMNGSVPKGSIHNYQKCLVHLKSFSNNKYKISWECLTLKFYQDYIKFLSEEYVNFRTGKKGIVNSTMGKDMWVIKNVCKYAKRQGIAVPFDVEDFDKPANNQVKRHTITEDRLNDLLKFYFNDWTLFTIHKRMQRIIEDKVIPNIIKVRDIYTFSFYTGLAHKEIMKIIPSQVLKEKIGDRDIYVLDFSRTKTRKNNAIPLNKVCLEIIDKYKGGKTILPYFANSQYNRICKSMFKTAGFITPITITQWSGDREITKTVPEWELLTSHTGRHSAATNILNKTGDLTLARDLLGHSSVKTTEVYTRNLKETFNEKILNVIDAPTNKELEV
jgi:site-specific recombinase XerD